MLTSIGNDEWKVNSRLLNNNNIDDDNIYDDDDVVNNEYANNYNKIIIKPSKFTLTVLFN